MFTYTILFVLSDKKKSSGARYKKTIKFGLSPRDLFTPGVCGSGICGPLQTIVPVAGRGQLTEVGKTGKEGYIFIGNSSGNRLREKQRRRASGCRYC